MICCKITADYSIICKNFTGILNDLSKRGLVLWDNQKLYFANIDESSVSSQFVKRVLKKNNCNNFFLEIYDENHEPRESDSANAWIQSQLIAIGYATLEKDHQDVLKQMSEQLTQLEQELHEYFKEQDSSDDKNTDNV